MSTFFIPIYRTLESLYNETNSSKNNDRVIATCVATRIITFSFVLAIVDSPSLCQLVSVCQYVRLFVGLTLSLSLFL